MCWKIAFSAALALAAPVTGMAAEITPPAVPANLVVEVGVKPFSIAHAVGTQNYICLPSGASVKWVQFSPQATLFTEDGKQVITHFLSPNPGEPNMPARATWQHVQDTSGTWAVMQQESDDPNFVAPGAIKWLLLRVVGNQYGPDSGDRLAKTKFIHRVNTSGGVAPATRCALLGDVGNRELVPYTADYVFYQ